jgi:hypothetical protein
MGETVSTTTLLHQLRRPWSQPLSSEQYYFCAQPGCDIVYFTGSGGQLGTAALRQAVGQKSTESDRSLCYCFDIRHSDLADDVSAKQCHDFVINETRNKRCTCEERNPSGKCCLRDFPKQEK